MQILQSTINVAVSSIAASIEHTNDVNAARSTAEHISRQIEQAGGLAWTNPRWYGCDVVEINAPTGRFGDRSFEYVKWPNTKPGDIVEYKNAHYRVVVNYVSPGKPGVWVEQFSFYAIIPV